MIFAMCSPIRGPSYFRFSFPRGVVVSKFSPPAPPSDCKEVYLQNRGVVG